MAMQREGQTKPAAKASAAKVVNPVQALGKGPVAANGGNYRPMGLDPMTSLQNATGNPIAPPRPTTGPIAPKGPIGGGTAQRGGGAAYGGGALGTTGTGLVAEQAAPPAPMDYETWKSQGGGLGDSAYMAEDASAESDYQALLHQLAQQNTDYMTGFRGGLKNLGLKFQGEDYASGTWDPMDQLGAYGNAFQNQQNDFSGRGLLDSTFYGDAKQNLDRRFDQQKQQSIQDMTAQQGQYRQSTADAQAARQNAQARALAEAYARYSGGYGA